MRDNWQRHHERHLRRRGGDKTGFGIIVVVIGLLLLLKTLHVFTFISFHHLWAFILILVGIGMGMRSRFMNPGSWILILIGTLNVIPEFTFMGQSSERLVWPLVLIMAGVFIILRSRKKKYFMEQRLNMDTITNADSLLNIDVTFGGRKEIITSKDFKGGSISATFAGAEVNLMQADSTTQPITLDIRVAFGGVELLVPSHWEIQNEIAPSFGSVEDHRVIKTPNAGEEKKILSLKGSCSFGSIEIKSY
jgi:predicted membrane protein